MTLNHRNIIIGGSSITETTAWPTWATWIYRRYQPSAFINVGHKGLGNELILLKAVEQAKKYKDPLLIVQLTNVDKWDWYVEDPGLIDAINQEKHPIVNLHDDQNQGFWSTGSHFPKWKNYYKENYFSLTYFTYRTLQLIQWFQLLCRQQKWQYYIIFDSPIFSVTENYLNNGSLTDDECNSMQLVDTTLSKTVFDLLDTTDIYLPGIIGYAQLNDYPWYSQKGKGHPGSLIHYYYTRDIVCPILDQILTPIQDFEKFKDEAVVFQKLFEKQ
jgi:hypothetical protein